VRFAGCVAALVAILPVGLLQSAVASEQPLSSAPLPQCAAGAESGLPLPSTFSANNDPAAFQTLLGAFLRAGRYEKLNWCEDKAVRDTGPWLNNAYYGTHPAVRVWYSPSAAKWVMNGRHGDVPDGAMIIKEQFAPAPAGQYGGWTREQLHTYFGDHYDWTFMIRDRKGSADGWYWGEIWKGQTPDSYAAPFAVFNTGFGLYCVRCHGSAESQMTFASQINIKGRPGQPLTFRDDLSWFWNGPLQPPDAAAIAAARSREEGAPLTERQAAAHLAPDNGESPHPHVTGANMPRLAVAHPAVSSDWSQFFHSTHVVAKSNPLPGENYDHVVAPPVKPRHFLTSDQCLGCHSGNRYGNVMLWTDTRVDSKPLVNVSPYGEWRWSPMGLAGRDPVFYAQLDSELAFLAARRPDQQSAIVNLCFSCHNAMGQRQLELDSGKPAYTTAIPKIDNLADPRFEYGALGRDGISCAVCHHIATTDHKSEMQFIEEDATGRFQLTPANQFEGPFEKPVTIPMKNSFGIEPVHDAYTQSGRICGTCHTIHLPVLDARPEATEAKAEECHPERFSYEQATYLEWVNSSYQNVIDPSKNSGSVKTCQDCHMKSTLNGTTIQTQIAAVEDDKYPAADFRAPNTELDVPIRASGYARHQFQGLNVFLLAMFDQFSDALGVRKCDYMSSGCSGQEPASGIPFALRNFLEQAAEDTASIAMSVPSVEGTTLGADVTVMNRTGHRFPSGVSFRRAFIDFKVVDSRTGTTLFESGATNSIGAIVDMKGNVLPSEFNGSSGEGGHAYQPHFWSPGKPVTSDRDVQIYEELLKDADGNFTTSFLRQDCHFKDNRILPLGWRKNGPDITKFYGKPLAETWSEATGDDPHYADPLGANGQSVVRYSVAIPAGTKAGDLVVTAQLYYQATPPYFLLQRFQQAPEGEGTQRLYAITSTLDTTKTPFPGWKLLVAQATR
jgi:hypothetical protein